jgi:hypothetical protein
MQSVAGELALRLISQEFSHSTDDTDAARDQLRGGVQAFLDACAGSTDFQRIVLIDGPAVLGPGTRNDLVGQHGPGLLRTWLQRAMNSHQIDPGPVDPLARLLPAHMAEDSLCIGHPADPARARRETGETIDRILAGLRSEPASPASRGTVRPVSPPPRHLESDPCPARYRDRPRRGLRRRKPSASSCRLRLVAVLAFTAWRTGQIAPPAAAGAFNDAAIMLLIIDGACLVVTEARARLAWHWQKAGGERFTFYHKHLVAAGPPAWRASPVSQGSALGWTQPACDPAGAWVAAIAASNRDVIALARPSGLWALGADGSAAHLLAGTGGGPLPDEPASVVGRRAVGPVPQNNGRAPPRLIQSVPPADRSRLRPRPPARRPGRARHHDVRLVPALRYQPLREGHRLSGVTRTSRRACDRRHRLIGRPRTVTACRVVSRSLSAPDRRFRAAVVRLFPCGPVAQIIRFGGGN